ncbi:hypothetical protein JQ580_02840 [Bradyrhizobium japonicum]|uniref:hypothetical protein n=1 Tax=Bradyrhizobium japonicum TaxID=375 RepID=UPI001BA6CE5A|nr:hypothetical protein [Bradyrhizobium japonicum]MBR0989649.1 hypothetical protein [Bradyrhizobium japonicum]
MSNSDLNKTSGSTKGRDTSPITNIKGQMDDAGAEMKQRAGDALQASSDLARDKFKEATDAAKEVADGAMDKIEGEAGQKQQAGADFVDRLAGNFREAARAFEKDVPLAARGINSAADYVEDAATKIRDGSFRDVLEGATDFAKRQPAAFLGMSVLAGFAVVRFLKASGGQASTSPQAGATSASRPGTFAAKESQSTPGSNVNRQQKSFTQGSSVS